NCEFCGHHCQKAGRQKNGQQKLFCKHCKKYQQENYSYAACRKNIEAFIPALICESVSVRGISRLLQVSLPTVLRKIRRIAAGIQKPPIPLYSSCFELDEVRTYIQRKGIQYWVAYALCSQTRKVVDFIVGKRSKRVLRSV